MGCRAGGHSHSTHSNCTTRSHDASVSTSAVKCPRPTPDIRWGPLLLLSFGAGGADAFAFTLLGGIFTANMTGNLVLVGLVGREHYTQTLLGASTAILVFTATAWFALRYMQSAFDRFERSSNLLAVGAASQITIAVVWSIVYESGGRLTITFLICLSAVAMAVQTVAARKMKAPGAVTTTFVTGTLIGLLDDLAQRKYRYVLSRIIAIATLVLGAVVVSTVLLTIPVAAPLIPALAGLTAYVVSLRGYRRSRVRVPQGGH